MRLNAKILSWSMMLALAVIASSGYIAYVEETRIITIRTEDLLEGIVVMKGIQFSKFVNHASDRIQFMASEKTLKNKILGMLEAQASTREDETPYKSQTREALGGYLNYDRDFTRYQILDLEGGVLASTQETDEGKIRSEEPYFQEGRSRTFSEGFYYDLSTEKPLMMIATPIRDAGGRTAAVFAGNVNIEKISEMMEDTTGLGETGETYLVNKFHYAVTELRGGGSTVLKKAINTEAVKHCLMERNEIPMRMHYTNYANEKVLGVHLWNKKNEVCFVAEISEEEALKPAKELRNDIIILGAVLLALSMLLSTILSRSISKPIKALSEGAKRISEGDLDHRMNIKTRDEIEELATAFNSMTGELKKSRSELQKTEALKRSELERLVNERTKELEEKSSELEQARRATLNILEDVSDSKVKLEKSYDELKTLDNMKDDFVGATSHALKTPLTSINSFIELLSKGKLGPINEDQKDGLEIIKAESQRLHVLINNILDAAKLDSGRMVLEKRKTDLRTIVENAIRSVSITAESKGNRITFSSPQTAYASIDAAWMEKTIDNFISNALKFTDNGKIEIKLEKDGRNVKFTITDTGRGIAPEHIPYMFEKFYQAEKQTTTGTGFGMYICKNVIKAHGGEVGASSPGLDKGATFWFTVPAE